MVMRLLISLALAIAFVCGGETPARAVDVFDIVRVTHPSANVEIVSIGQPNVKQAVTEYTSITFAPGDAVMVTADGCVQTGGSGETWKRYVNPSGDNSDHEYYGEIWIPGATGVLVPIAGIANRTWTVPNGTTNAGEFLRLGYVDDNYSDNGYYSHDNGTENQCAGSDGGPASVTLTITHNAVPPTFKPIAPWDLYWTEVDENAIPFDALWGQQVDNKVEPFWFPWALPLNACPPAPWMQPCTTQAPKLDLASWPNSTFACEGQGGPIDGHANWGPGTYDGNLSWESKSPAGLDDDYSLNLGTTNDAGATETRPNGFHIEFDSDETIDHFGSPWWNTLQNSVDNGQGPSPEDILDDKYAIVTGLVDLDCAHPCGGELHPVWVLALRYIGDPRYEEWAIFVRNWGDEGGCASDDHQLMLADNQYTLRIPWPSGATSVGIGSATSFFTNSTATSMTGAAVVPGVGTMLTFNLPDPGQHALIDGLLELIYSPAAPAPSPTPVRSLTPLPIRPQPKPSIRTVEQFAASVSNEEDRLPPMTAAQLKIYRAHFPASVYPRSTATVAVPALHVLSAVNWNFAHRRAKPRTVPAVIAVPDQAKQARDVARAQAVYAAFGGHVPGLGPLGAGPGITARTPGPALPH
jgi:hypothetical protein